jgi:16S rRNA (cytosine1402-N4)-methyltransferase
METTHTSVLFNEVLEYLDIQENDVVVDGTLGGAGHFTALLGKLGKEGVLIGIDADGDAITRAEVARDEAKSPATVHVVKNNFRNLDTVLETLKIEKISKALFDLGWSSFHLESGRGFSFQAHEPLLMTYGEPTEHKTVAELINSAPEEELSDIIFQYGEERFARGIAKSITRARKLAPILTTDDLVRVIEEGTPEWYQHRRLHPATKTFQAFRIAINDELGALRDGLLSAMNHLTPGGRVAVITFHSIEDRIVKTIFREAAYAGQGTVITRKPIGPSDREVMSNPRARSAKLRVFERCTRGGVEESGESFENSAPITTNQPSYDYAK